MEQSDNEQLGFWAIIPASVLLADIPASAKILFAAISGLTKWTGYCWASNAYFAKIFNVKPWSISNWVKILRENDFIRTEIDKNVGNKRKIWLTAKITTPIEKIHDTPIEKIHTQNSINSKEVPPSISEKNSFENIVRLWTEETKKDVSGSEFYAAQLELTGFPENNKDIGSGFGISDVLEAIKNYGEALRLPNSKVWTGRNLVDFIRKCKNFLPGYFNIERYRDEYQKQEPTEDTEQPEQFKDGHSPKDAAMKKLRTDRIREVTAKTAGATTKKLSRIGGVDTKTAIENLAAISNKGETHGSDKQSGRQS